MQQQWVRKTLENLCAMQGIQRVYWHSLPGTVTSTFLKFKELILKQLSATKGRATTKDFLASLETGVIPV